ncbi:VRR-NUC domain-containing protein, partial [Parabacteroides goldsteinii]|uniref:VRR-NUC domain-containing protein n=1 Tax=Parabacteroides goldsteinii TaxID=328812 RepID=UPI00259BDAE9
MKAQKCIACGRETVSVIKTEEGYICYNCYSDKKNLPKQKQHHDNEEARIQSEFFNKVPLFFPNLPDRLLFAVPNGGSRHKIEAANMKRQGVKRGVADVILQIPKKG